MVASDVETSVAANGVRENVLACTGGDIDIGINFLIVIVMPNHHHPHPYPSNHPQHDDQETRRGEKDSLTLRRIASLQLTRVTPTEELPTPQTVEGK